MTKEEHNQLQKLHKIYSVIISDLRKAISDSDKSKDVADAIKNLQLMNKDNDLDFDKEIMALKNANINSNDIKAVTVSILKNFQIYLRNHAEPDTKHALKVINHDLTSKDYTKNYNQTHLYQAYIDSYFYFVPCGDVTTLRTDLINGNYFNLKGDLKTIKSNREDLLRSSHNGNIKQFMGKTERESVKRHNE